MKRYVRRLWVIPLLFFFIMGMGDLRGRKPAPRITVRIFFCSILEKVPLRRIM
nr:hypothetical protein [Bacillus licheniformis]